MEYTSGATIMKMSDERYMVSVKIGHALNNIANACQKSQGEQRRCFYICETKDEVLKLLAKMME